MPRRIMEGVVVSDKQDKTVTVRVTRRVKDPLYGKFITKSAKFAVHDEKNECAEGDVVRIEECRPLSKNKSWRVVGTDIDTPKKTKAPGTKTLPKKAEADRTDADVVAAQKTAEAKNAKAQASDDKKETKKAAPKKKSAASKTTKKDDK